MMEHAGTHREPTASAFWQKAQISCISCPKQGQFRVGYNTDLVFFVERQSDTHRFVPGGFSTGLWLLHHWQTYRHQNPQLNQMNCMERLKRNFYSLGYYCTPNLSIHQNSTQKLTWNFLVTLEKPSEIKPPLPKQEVSKNVFA